MSLYTHNCCHEAICYIPVNTFTHTDADLHFLLHRPQYEAILPIPETTKSIYKLCTFTSPDVDLERKLLDPSHASYKLDDDTLQQLADAIGEKWASIAPLLSFTMTEIEKIRNEDCPARAMLQKLKEKGIVTHEQLCTQLQTISLFKPTI